MKRQAWLVIGFLLAMCTTAVAQENPNSADYHARHNTNSPYYTGGAQQSTAPQPIWADRWGAIATDGETGSLGVSADMRSKGKAQKEALANCRSNGGLNCEVDIAYYNQCAAMVLGSKKYNTARAPTKEEAISMGMDTCSKGGNANCRVYYSGCSTAVRVQ